MPDKGQVSRREFLRKAGQAAAGAGVVAGIPTIIPGSAWGADGTPPSEQIRLGFIGVKNRGMQNLAPLMKLTKVAAVCDVDQTVLASAKAVVDKAQGGSCATYSDYRKLLESKDIDAVVISTPDHWHALMTINACEAGKDVYCEKPLTLVVDEGKAMVKAARQYKRIVQTGSQQRSDDKFRQACELVRSGKLGKIHTVLVGIPGVNYKEPNRPDSEPPAELDYQFWLGPAPYRPYNVNHVHYNFRWFWDYSGGQMTNFGAHHLDIAQWGLGMDESGPISAEGQAKFDAEKRYEVAQWSEVTYKYANGVTVICGMEQKGGVTFQGEKGSIWVTRGKIESTPPELLMETLTDSDVHLYNSKDHYKNWLECIKSRKLPICDVAIGHRSATVCHLGNLSMRTGRKVTWDPKAEKVVGDAEQQHMLSYNYRSPWKLPG